MRSGDGSAVDAVGYCNFVTAVVSDDTANTVHVVCAVRRDCGFILATRNHHLFLRIAVRLADITDQTSHALLACDCRIFSFTQSVKVILPYEYPTKPPTPLLSAEDVVLILPLLVDFSFDRFRLCNSL